MKKVAIITRTKNRPLMLPRALKSVQSQSFKDFVWVIVNDAGEQSYVEKGAELARKQGHEVVVLHNSKSSLDGATDAGVQCVDSKYVAIHDDDDSWHPDFLETMVSILDEREEYVGAVCHEVKIFEEINGDNLRELKRVSNDLYMDGVQLADMLQQNLFAPISFLVRRSVYNDVGGWDVNFRVLGDWDFNLKVLLKGDIVFVPGKLAHYHIRKQSCSGRVDYGNTITSGIGSHLSQDAKYRNQKIRDDLANGAVGLGFLLCQARQTANVVRSVSVVTRVFQLPTDAWKRLKLFLGR